DLPVIVFGCGALLVAVLVSTFGNYFYGWHFGPTAVALATPLMTAAMILIWLIGPKWQLQPITTDIDPQLLAAMLLVLLAVLVLAAVAVAASTRLGQVMTMVVCTGAFVLGLISSYAFGRFKDQSLLANIGYRITPELTFFWLGDALTQGQNVTAAHVGWVCLYAVLYIAAVLALGVSLFQRRELG
ncbi:MAG: hypothetical protein ACE5K7_06405, partial [Phycisphaerae bacterium]